MEEIKPTYGIFTTDRFLNIKTWNDWLEEVCGIQAEQAVGKNITEVIPDMENRGLMKRFHKVLSEGTVEILSSVFHHYLIPCQITGKGNDGDSMQMKQHVTIGPVKTDHHILGLIVTIEDASAHQHFLVAQTQPDQQISQLGHSDWHIRKEARLDLTRNADNSTLASILRIMKEEHQDVSVLNSILLVLSQTETDIVGALLSLMEENDTDLRMYILQTLGDRNDPRAIPTLLQCLNDPDANIKYHAIEALGKLSAREATDRLCEMATSGDFFIAFPAIDALTKLNDSNVIPRIIQLVDDPIYTESFMTLMGKLGDVSMVEMLIRKLNEPDALVSAVSAALVEIHRRYDVLYSEGEIIKDEANKHIHWQGIQNLVNAAHHPESEGIKDIIKVLGWIGSTDAQRELTQMLGNPDLQKEVIESFVNFGFKVTDLLIDQLYAQDELTRTAAAIALGRISDPRSANDLIRMIGVNDELTVFVLGSLAKLGAQEAFEPVMLQLGAENSSVRRAAVAALNSIGHPQMPERIKKLLQSENPLERESAIQVAGYFGYPECKDLIIQSLDDPDLRIACAAIENLPFFNDPLANKLLDKYYRLGPAKIRRSVMKASFYIDEISLFEPLAMALSDEDSWVRYYAIRSIGNRLLPDYLPQLIDRIQNDRATHVRLAAIDTLGKLNATQAIPVLSGMLNDPSSDIVQAILYALGMMQSGEAMSILLRLLDRPEFMDRIAVIKAISHFNAEEVIDRLFLISAAGSDNAITDAALEGLSRIPSEKAVESLLRLATMSKMKEKCISLLVKQKDLALPYLINAFDSRDLVSQRATIEILSRTKDWQASNALIGYLDHENAQIRIDAMNALFHIGNMNYLEKVERMSHIDPDLFVRYTAKEILKKV